MISRLENSNENGGNRTLLVISVMLATLMQALDTTIANVALPDMQGSLSATQDQVSWVLTSYIVAAAILTPVTGWLAGRLGRRRLLIIAVAGFTVASLLCGIASGIGEMVFYRVLQGVFGASLVPISQSLLLDSFPKEKHGAAMAMWGMGIMIGPILGPPLGGFLTQNYSWHWVFLINLPIGILALIGIMASVKKDAPHERPLDGIGLGLLALGIGALQLFLDRGQGEDWFGSLEVQIEAALALLALWGYGLWWWNKREHALLDLSLLKNGNFAVGCALIFIVGIVLFATLALLPPYLSTLMNYPVLTIGLVLAPRGIGTMFTMMLVGRMLGRVDARIPILVGMGLMVISLHGMTLFGPTASMSSIIWLGVIQGMGLGLVFVPISTVAYATLEPHQRTEAAGLFSLVRNIGSSVGISVVMTLLSRAMQINHAEIGSRIPAFGAELAALPAAWNPATTTGAALLNAEVMKQSAAIGYLNDFKLMMVLTLLSMPLVFFMQSGKAPAGGNPGADAAAAH
ncbi:MDR family MFS transporter [Pseudoxanthomonas indica]|uniref:MFS transporter, DHA2 family, multidrug resistance protein n=1 Tax=Pseudoxanthomonas indica TaxID=428993 RepID=A0A1T5JT01_9GAMM|nr:MDR family MFS transporter [Pseudoxanthomonas indica]GGD44155.1 EmrB/QacA family drug resistance transporter [Pseudoxanthomonas indica]SKC54513.1 MFS transporter, DHA2 family, multidrug resistance protein [Pseudoxanthomonas indica]